MPGVTQYVLKGGPCDGKTGDLTPDIDSTGQIECKGALYKRGAAAKVVGGREQFSFAGKAPTSSGSVTAPKAHGGWSDLQRSFNRRWHPALDTADKLNRAALRSLNRAHRVKR